MATSTKVSGAEAERRAKQSAQSEQSTSQVSEQSTQEALVQELGASVGLTPAEAAQAATDADEQVAATNLDELVVKTLHVKYRELVPITVKLLDGREVTRNQVVISEIDLIGDVDAETQLRIMAMAQDRPDSRDPQVLSRFYAQQVLVAWQMTDPDMTLEKLLRGLDMVRIRKLGQDFFN